MAATLHAHTECCARSTNHHAGNGKNQRNGVSCIAKHKGKRKSKQKQTACRRKSAEKTMRPGKSCTEKAAKKHRAKEQKLSIQGKVRRRVTARKCKGGKCSTGKQHKQKCDTDKQYRPHRKRKPLQGFFRHKQASFFATVYAEKR